MRAPIAQPESHLQYLTLALAELIENGLELFSEHVHRRGIHRTRQVLVLDEVRELAVFLIAHGAFERHRFL